MHLLQPATAPGAPAVLQPSPSAQTACRWTFQARGHGWHGAALTLLLVVFALLFACLLPTPAHAARTYGQLCSKYESSDNPALIDPGSAYGAYQMSPGNAYSFAVWMRSSEDVTVAAWGKKLVNAYQADGNTTGATFDAKWRAVAKADSTLFFNQQYLYCKSAYYSTALTYWKQVAPGLKAGDYTYALRAVIFSTAIQHGPYGSAYYILKPALESVGGWKVGMDEATLIKAVYEERARATSTKPASGAIAITKANCSSTTIYNQAVSYGIAKKYLAHFYSSSADWQVSIYNRLFNNEKADALALYEKYAEVSYGISYKLKGGTLSSGAVTSYKKSSATFALPTPTREGCAFVGWYETAARTGTPVTKVKKGTTGNKVYYAKWVKGYNATVNIASGKLNVRKSRSTSAKVVASYKKGTKVIIRKVKGNWAKVFKVGWVNEDYLCYSAQVATKGAKLKVYQSRSTKATVVSKLKNGTTVTIAKGKGGWAKVKKLGWVKQCYLKAM